MPSSLALFAPSRGRGLKQITGDVLADPLSSPPPLSHMTSKALIWDQMTQQDPTPIQGPRQVEPEIIPPRVAPVGRSRIRISAAPHYTMRIEMTRLGPVGIVMLVLIIVILGLAGLTLLLGFALVGLAAAGVLIVGAILSGLLRRLSG
jgi:hypothetical protein